MNTVSSTDAQSSRSGSQQDIDTFSIRPPQKSTSTSRTSGGPHNFSPSSSVNLPSDEYFFKEETSTSSTTFANPYIHHSDAGPYDEEYYGDGDTLQQQQQRQLEPQQLQLQHQQQRSHQQQQPLQDPVHDVNSFTDSLRYQGRQGLPLQTQGPSTLRGHPHPQSQQVQPQLPYLDHPPTFEAQHQDQQYQPGGLRFDNPSQRIWQQPHRPYLPSRDPQEAFDDEDEDDDLEDFLDQEPSRMQESIDLFQQSNPSSSNTLQRPPRPNSSHEVHSNNFITEEEFLMLADDYLLSLSPKKREKALLSNAMYQKILMVLLQPKNTQVSTAQFRFWAKKMFTLSTTETHHIVCHSGKPVATKECLYDVLVYCHRKSSHGGRDKTSAEVRQHYSWVPKELIARFVKHCPLCSSRRHSLQRSLSGTGLPGSVFELFVPSSGSDDREDQRHFSASSDSYSGSSSQLDQYSMADQLQAGSDESIYLSSPQDYRLSHVSSILPTDRTQQPLQQGARLHSEHMMQLHHQRMQTDNSVGRFHDDRPPLRGQSHLRSVSGSVHDLTGTQTVARGGGFTHPDSSGIGPPGDRTESLQGNFRDGLRRHGWSRDSRIDSDIDQDVEMLVDGSDYGRGDGGGAIRRSSYNEIEPMQPRGGHVNNTIEAERDDDCTPSGLVGVLQEVRGSASTGAIRRNSQNSAYNRLYLHQQQQQQHQQHQQQHGIDQGSSSSQTLSPSVLNQHPSSHLSRSSGYGRLVMGYPYGYPYPYNPAAGSSGTGYGSSKQIHGPSQIPSQQQHQQQQQQRQSTLSHSTSTTFPQMASGPSGAFQEMREHVTEEGYPGNPMVLARGEDKDRDGQLQGHGQGHAPG